MSSRTSEPFFDYIEFDRVVGEGLASFPDRVGFFETRRPGAYVAEALDAFFLRFGDRIPQCQLFSSLTDYSGATEYWTEEDKHVAADLERRGWLQFGKDKEDALRSFSQAAPTAVDVDAVRGLCSLVLKGLTYGYAFLYWGPEGLVAYPDEHEGFGFIAKAGTAGEQLARDFLGTLKQSDRWDVELTR